MPIDVFWQTGAAAQGPVAARPGRRRLSRPRLVETDEPARRPFPSARRRPATAGRAARRHPRRGAAAGLRRRGLCAGQPGARGARASACSGCRHSSTRAGRATWAGWASAPRSAPIRNACGTTPGRSCRWRSTTARPADPLEVLEERERAAISVYAQGRDYHEVMKSKLKALGRFIWDTYRHDLKVFVDTAPLDGKARGAGAGLGWQGKHTNLVSRAVRLLAVPRRDAAVGRAAGRRAGDRSLRPVPRLPRRLPDQRLSRALPARCAALHLLSHHRA